MDEHEKTLTVDPNTVASHPGELKVQPLRWVIYRPLWPILWIGLLVLALYFAVTAHWAYYVLVTLLAAINWFYWRRLKEHFYVGCANPAKIISVNPFMVASNTDLRCSFDAPHCHSIKITKWRLPKINGCKLKVGDKIPTVSLYNGLLDKDRWHSFSPIPACLVSNAQSTIDAIHAGLEDEWDKLELWLAKVPKPYQPGLYAFDQGNDIPRGATQEPPQDSN